jgi:hypothetical protein
MPQSHASTHHLITGCRRARIAPALIAALAAGLSTGPLRAEPTAAGDWISTWTASPQEVWEPDFFAPVAISRSLRNQTLRQVARVSVGGSRCASCCPTSTAPSLW